MPIVLRVEDKYSRVGMYNAGFMFHINDFGTPSKPIPYKDIELTNNLWKSMTSSDHNCYRFGFNSPKQFRKWLSFKECKRLVGHKDHREKAVLSFYWVPERALVVWKRQIAFEARWARCLSHIPVDSHLNKVHVRFRYHQFVDGEAARCG